MKNAILTNSELDWLTGKKKVSKIYEYRIKSDIKKKIAILKQLELPLLAKHGFTNDLSVFPQLNEYPQLSTSINSNQNQIRPDSHPIRAQNSSLGRDFPCVSTLLDPRPFPYQGNALPG